MEPEKGHGWKRKKYLGLIPTVGFQPWTFVQGVYGWLLMYTPKVYASRVCKKWTPLLQRNNYPKFNKDRKRVFQCLATIITIIFREQVFVLGTVVFCSALFGIPHCPFFCWGKSKLSSLLWCRLGDGHSTFRHLDWVPREYWSISRNPKHLNISP